MDAKALPTELDDCHRLIATLQSQVDKQASELQSKQTQLALQEKLVEEQAHSVLELKENNDRLDKQVTELNLKLEKLLQQLYGRKSERRIDGAGQLLLDLGEEATPEVVSALEEAIREAEQVVESAEDKKKKRRPKRPRKDDRKFPEHLPRYERIVDIPEELREGLKFLGYDEIETLEWIRPELRVRLSLYAKYAHPADKSQGIISPERPTGLVEGDRFDASIGVEVVAWKYFYHLPFYRQQDLFAGSGWTPSRSTLQNIEAAVEFTLRPLAEYLRSYLKTDACVGCDDTGVLLITPNVMPDLPDHPRGERISEVFQWGVWGQSIFWRANDRVHGILGREFGCTAEAIVLSRPTQLGRASRESGRLVAGQVHLTPIARPTKHAVCPFQIALAPSRWENFSYRGAVLCKACNVSANAKLKAVPFC